jgi:hypothetical protein
MMVATATRLTQVEQTDAELRSLLRRYLVGEVDDATFWGLTDRLLERRRRAQANELADRWWTETFDE